MGKSYQKILLVLLLIVGVFTLTACGKAKQKASSVVGVWEYEATGYTVTYEFNADGTGKYILAVGKENSTKNLNYEVKDGKLLITFENDKDVFESDFEAKDKDTLSIKDSFGEEFLYKRVVDSAKK